VKRWFQYQEPDGVAAFYTSRVTLVCRLCQYKFNQDPGILKTNVLIPYLRGDWRYKTMSLRGMIEHVEKEHSDGPCFVSLHSLHRATAEWLAEWRRMNWRTGYLVNYPYLGSYVRRRDLLDGGITS
jgi:hypothetical protein